MNGAPSEPRFGLAGTAEGLDDLRVMVGTAIDILQNASTARSGPVAPGGPREAGAVASRLLSEPLMSEHGGDPLETFTELAGAYAHWAVDVTHPAALARMQCPPTVGAVAAELVAATVNQSLHAWESGPFGLELDRWVIAQLAELIGYGAGAGGTLTPGGSVSNLMALIVARDSVLAAKLGRFVSQEGLIRLGVQPVVLGPEGIGTHFSTTRAARIVGIGEDQVIRVPTDDLGRMVPEAADRILANLPDNQVPVALFACAGSTDLGIVDPLPELVAVAREHGVWLHADAAYGGGALFSTRLRGMLDGMSEADSVAIDLHKFGWTPASSSLFLVKRAETLSSFGLDPTTCLTADDDTIEGYIGSQSSSLQTTRRVDALKIAVTLRTLGSRRMGEMVDICHDLARHAAARIAAEPRLDLAVEPPLSAVLFRYLPRSVADINAFNGALRRRLMCDGATLLARTHLSQEDDPNTVFLKIIVLNPETTPEQIDAVIDHILAVAAELDVAGAVAVAPLGGGDAKAVCSPS
ncbi:pyridoxal phosphate-dependent decarboxylase family protein [Actinokineospora globicatena]|uniref:L-2,4-diaminobutyrate decarboxylase n=1 Tax=Actinokineospora globicatena TaxID=103729 RepID=A0A9W6QJQ8_9PSEU|nr:pyridoxal-dependent decarboxylase [Actinokineospora globicatena]GLW89864.1 L-2,4-diaminobutyrate decarboxylase [Actinokineospora globicatena]